MKFCVDIMPHVEYQSSKFQLSTLSIVSVMADWIREVEGWWGRN
jgi:hypothetical protein